MTETARENPGNLTCLQWHNLHAGAHRLFEAIWAEMEALTASREPGRPMPPDWAPLHDLLTLTSVISTITGRHASQAALLPALLPAPQADEPAEDPPGDYDPGPECDDEGGMSEHRHFPAYGPEELW